MASERKVSYLTVAKFLINNRNAAYAALARAVVLTSDDYSVDDKLVAASELLTLLRPLVKDFNERFAATSGQNPVDTLMAQMNSGDLNMAIFDRARLVKFLKVIAKITITIAPLLFMEDEDNVQSPGQGSEPDPE